MPLGSEFYGGKASVQEIKKFIDGNITVSPNYKYIINERF